MLRLTTLTVLLLLAPENALGQDAAELKPADTCPGFDFECTIAVATLDAKSVGSAARKKLNVALKGDALEGTVVNLDRRTTARVSIRLER